MPTIFTRPPQARRDALLPVQGRRRSKRRKRTLWGTLRTLRDENAVGRRFQHPTSLYVVVEEELIRMRPHPQHIDLTVPLV
jgi:hypothetical protein